MLFSRKERKGRKERNEKMTGECKGDHVVLRDGVLVHEIEDLCRRLEKANVPFELSQVSRDDAGIVESHRNNWSTALGSVMNYFNQGGVGVFLRILVRPEDFERADAALNIESAPMSESDRKRLSRRRLLIVVLFIFALVFAFLFVKDVQQRHQSKISISTWYDAQ